MKLRIPEFSNVLNMVFHFPGRIRSTSSSYEFVRGLCTLLALVITQKINNLLSFSSQDLPNCTLFTFLPYISDSSQHEAISIHRNNIIEHFFLDAV
jgi:hypothetical protein